jgi:hypothetical protein
MRNLAAPMPHTADGATSAAQDAIRQKQRELRGLPFTGGKVKTAVVPAGGIVDVAHGLGRTPKGWIQLDVTGDPLFVRSAWDAASIQFTSIGANPAYLTFWVY